MAIRRLERVATQVSWAASGSINLELAPKPYTITALVLILRPSVTTTTATWLNDPWDRIISTLSLSGGGRSYLSFTNLRAAYHFTRFQLGRLLRGYKRPTVVGNSATTLVNQFAYVFHLGSKPAGADGEWDPWDLSAGIPPVSSGNLTLQGTFAAASAMGTNVTTADCDFDVYLFGVQPEPGDPPSLYLPKAFPAWSMQSPTPTATSSAFGTQHNVPAGHLLRAALVMLTNGTGAPRDDSVLNSFEVFYGLENRQILAFGGQAGSVLDYKAAEIISQLEVGGWPPSDDVTTALTAYASTSPGVPAITQPADSGLIWLPLYKFTKVGKGHPLYGIDLRRVATGDLSFRYGVSDATGVTMDVLYQQYDLNPEHPDNAGAA